MIFKKNFLENLITIYICIKEHKKLQELQVIQASNFLLLSKLFSNLTINNNFRFHLPMSSEKKENYLNKF